MPGGTRTHLRLPCRNYPSRYKEKYQRTFSSDKIAKAGIQQLHTRFLQKFSRPDKEVTLEEIMDDVLPGGIFFPTAPPKIFALENSVVTTTPVDYLKSLGFDRDDYYLVASGDRAVKLGAEREEDFDAIIQSVKATLAAKSPALLAVSADAIRWRQIDPDLGYTNVFSAPYWVNLDRNAMHMVTAVDFVNRGGRQGGMTPEELKREVETHPRMLDYLLVKNSWGPRSAVENDVPGYFRLSRDFLIANSFVREDDSVSPLQALVLKKFVNLPEK